MRGYFGTRTPVYWTDEERELLIDNYHLGYAKDILHLFPGRSLQSLKTMAMKMGLKSSKDYKLGARKHNLDVNFWSEFTNENCYWSGLLAADGCVRNHRKHYYLLNWYCSVKDEEHLNLFKTHVNYDGPTHYREARTQEDVDKRKANGQLGVRGGKMCYVQIHNCNQWFDDLENKFSIFPCKTFRLQPLKSDNLYHHLCWLKGEIDGDGSIIYSRSYNKKYDRYYESLCVKVYSSAYSILEYIKRLCETIIPSANNKIAKCTDSKCWSYSLHGKEAFMLYIILKQIRTPELSRKWNQEDFIRRGMEFAEDFPEKFEWLKDVDVENYNNIKYYI